MKIQEKEAEVKEAVAKRDIIELKYIDLIKQRDAIKLELNKVRKDKKYIKLDTAKKTYELKKRLKAMNQIIVQKPVTALSALSEVQNRMNQIIVQKPVEALSEVQNRLSQPSTEEVLVRPPEPIQNLERPPEPVIELEKPTNKALVITREDILKMEQPEILQGKTVQLLKKELKEIQKINIIEDTPADQWIGLINARIYAGVKMIEAQNKKDEHIKKLREKNPNTRYYGYRGDRKTKAALDSIRAKEEKGLCDD